MSTRFTWLLGILVLISVGLIVACNSNFNSSSDGLVILASQGDDLLQAFSFNLSSGSATNVNTNPNPRIPGPPDQGSKATVLLDHTGTYLYVTSTFTPNPVSDPCTSTSVIATYKVNSDGTIDAIGTTTPTLTANPAVYLTMDSAGQYLFLASSATCVSGNPAQLNPGAISVFSIGSGASLTEVSGSPFFLPLTAGGAPPNPLEVAVSPMTFPTQNSACSAAPTPSGENLYVPDANNNEVFEFSVNASSGFLTVVPPTAAQTGPLGLPGTPTTGSAPFGVAVDPCNRFVFVTNQGSNNISVFTICNGGSTQSPLCPIPPAATAGNGSLVQIQGSPISAGSGPGPIVVDPLANYVYAVNTLGAQISCYRLSQITGSLSPLNPSTQATGTNPVSIAIRGDDQWLFVTNNGSTSGFGSLSEFSITPSTGVLTPTSGGIQTDTYPAGTAVK